MLTLPSIFASKIVKSANSDRQGEQLRERLKLIEGVSVVESIRSNHACETRILLVTPTRKRR